MSVAVPNIISGRVTNRSNSQRRTPNWLKALYAVIFGLFAIVAISVALAPAQEAKPSIPVCELEDGSTQDVCLFSGNIINMQHGRYSYDGAMHDWTNE